MKTTNAKTETMTRAAFLEAVAPGANRKYGAPMGRDAWPARLIENRGRYPGEPAPGPSRATLAAIPRRFYLRALPLDSGGYDPGGAYWGHGMNGSTLYAAYAPADIVEHNGEALELDAARLYVRARNRDHAKREVVEWYPGARFYDGERGPVAPSGFYRIAREWCGYETARWVVRFRGEWIGQRETLEAAETLAENHQRGRVNPCEPMVFS